MEPDQIVAVATVALAIAAITLSMITYVMANEARISREETAMPLCACDLQPRTVETTPGAFNVILVENVGNAPALETRVDLLAENTDHTMTPLRESWYIGTIGVWHPGVEAARAECVVPTGVTSLRLAVVHCNTERVGFRTEAKFELVEDESTPEAHRTSTQRFHWVKRSETFRLMGRRWFSRVAPSVHSEPPKSS